MRKLTASLLVTILMLAGSSLYAGVPDLMNYQGEMRSAQGDLLDTTVSITFTIYDDSTGGVPLWSEIHPNVVVNSGRFSVILGTYVPGDANMFDDANRWLGIAVGADP